MTQPPADGIPRTYVTGPSDPVSFTDGAGTYAEVDIAAPPETVWSTVTDINAPAAFSDEFVSGKWVDDTRGLGARFVGANKHPHIGEWELECIVHEFEEHRAFGWVTVNVENPGAQWVFRLTPTETGTRLRYELILGPGPSGLTVAIEAQPDKEDRIIAFRLREHHAAMCATVEGIRNLAESA